MPVKLFLIDDHALFREGLATVLEGKGGFTVLGKADSVRSALDALPGIYPDLILLDVDLGNGRALEFLRKAREQQLNAPVLIVTAGVSDFEAMQLVHAGVRGIFHKHNPPDALCEAIRKVAAGDVVMEPGYLRGLFAAVDPAAVDTRPRLTDRELSVLRLILQGLANKEIADHLGISESSVKAVLRGLFEKLNARTRSQLVKIVLDQYRDQL
ncbi:MAG: response regulator transcription factor [Acidobacteria bacterium]|nr:response regulator transcription factor [Acidobacteriota bacterium]